MAFKICSDKDKLKYYKRIFTMIVDTLIERQPLEVSLSTRIKLYFGKGCLFTDSDDMGKKNNLMLRETIPEIDEIIRYDRHINTAPYIKLDNLNWRNTSYFISILKTKKKIIDAIKAFNSSHKFDDAIVIYIITEIKRFLSTKCYV
jgi:hypothetical protein